MATIGQRIRMFLASPQGKQMIARGQQEIAKPANQQKLRSLLARFRGRR